MALILRVTGRKSIRNHCSFTAHKHRTRLHKGKHIESIFSLFQTNLSFRGHQRCLCLQKKWDMSISEVTWHNLAFYRANILSVSMSERDAAWISLHQSVTLQSPCHPLITLWQTTSGAVTWESQVSHYFKMTDVQVGTTMLTQFTKAWGPISSKCRLMCANWAEIRNSSTN